MCEQCVHFMKEGHGPPGTAGPYLLTFVVSQEAVPITHKHPQYSD